ncbi:MAG: hemolysin family protein [Mangrovibacterium sp.]
MDIILLLSLSLLLSAFFTGVEHMWLKTYIEIPVCRDSYHDQSPRSFACRRKQIRYTLLIGKYATLVCSGIFLAFELQPVFERIVPAQTFILALQIASACILILCFTNLLPAILFRQASSGILQTLSVFLKLFYYLFYPLTLLFARQKSGCMAEGKRDDGRMQTDRNEPEQYFIEKDQSALKTEGLNTEVKLFRNAMDFSKVKLREIMVPRTEMAAMDINSGFEDLRKLFVSTGYSRILFYQDNIDNIIGYIHHSTIFTRPESIRSALKKVLIVPETMPASKLLSIFIQQHRSIAIVVDEFGGTSGMVTSEDLLEEIFGEIEDEHDTTDWIEKQLSEDEFIFSARIDLDILNEKYGLGFPAEENYETLAGYILYHHESIPKVNTVISSGKFRIKILKATSTRIELVNLKVLSRQA